MNVIIPQPTPEYFELTARDAARVAHHLAAKSDPFDWKLFKYWITEYNRVNGIDIHRTKTVEKRPVGRPRKYPHQVTGQTAIPV